MSNKNVKYCGIRPRLFAFMLDIIIITALAAVPLAAVFLLTRFEFMRFELAMGILSALKDLLWPVLLGIIYTIRLVSSKKQSTFAMRFFKIIVVNEKMERLSLEQSIMRFMDVLFVIVFTFGLGFLTTIYRKDRRGLHDIIAKTYVIYK
jgi:uncharacterized RDD family membrane protein YckC